MAGRAPHSWAVGSNRSGTRTDRSHSCPQASQQWTSGAAGMMGTSRLRSNAFQKFMMMANNRYTAPTTTAFGVAYRLCAAPPLRGAIRDERAP